MSESLPAKRVLGVFAVLLGILVLLYGVDILTAAQSRSLLGASPLPRPYTEEFLDIYWESLPTLGWGLTITGLALIGVGALMYRTRDGILKRIDEDSSNYNTKGNPSYEHTEVYEIDEEEMEAEGETYGIRCKSVAGEGEDLTKHKEPGEDTKDSEDD